MKKVLFAAFAGVCVLTSIMAAPAHKGNVKSAVVISHFANDTIPGKSDTSKYPKPTDTTSMPKLQGLK